jgi:hypothetical protein
MYATPRSSRKYTGTERYRKWLPKQNLKGSASKRNNEQMGLRQTKELLHSKGNSHQIQETAHRMGKNLCQLLIWYKGLISRIYRELKKKSQPPKNQHPNEEMGTWIKQGLLKGRGKKGSISLVIKEIQIKTTLRFHLTPVRMAIIMGNNNNKCWQGCGKIGTLIHCWWECKLVQPLWKAVWRFLKKPEIELPYDPVIPLWASTQGM